MKEMRSHLLIVVFFSFSHTFEVSLRQLLKAPSTFCSVVGGVLYLENNPAFHCNYVTGAVRPGLNF